MTFGGTIHFVIAIIRGVRLVSVHRWTYLQVHNVVLVNDIGQTSRACAVPAKTAPYKRLKFPKSFALKPTVKTITKKLRFIRRLSIGNLIIVIH